MAHVRVALDDKYRLIEGRAFMTGTQALVRLCLDQRRRDAEAGLATAGYVTGYRGSPLGGVDREFWRAEDLLADIGVRFHPAVNEDLAATAIWGAQQLPLFKDARRDGVFAVWYGKGPGVDRSGDVFRHANLAGTSRLGGVLALAGDDPGCKSSTVPSQSDFALIDAGMPLLHPSDVQELLDFGLLGFALSRFSGCWVGLKAVSDVIDASAAVVLDPARARPAPLPDVVLPPGGPYTRWPDPPMEQEERLYRFKIPAAAAFARANNFDRVMWDSPRARLGLIASGKTFRDLVEACALLGVDEAWAGAHGARLLKIGFAWPLDAEMIRRFARGVEEIVVVEEKRALLEPQIKDHLYGLGGAAPRVVGKRDEAGGWLFPPSGEIGPEAIARALAPRLARLGGADAITARIARLDGIEKRRTARADTPKRIPYFCAGCPHNTSTRVPEGSRALAGIGCHYMAIWMDRDTATFSHMGGEGAAWIGQAPFSATPHVFANIGDGTYFHSGLLTIRAAVAAGVNMTYKILYNDAVAMTGGQPMDGPLDVPRITAPVRAEGVERIAVVADEPELYRGHSGLAPGATVHHRDELDQVQRGLREWPGVSVLVYAQTCAAEKRRRRKRGKMPDPPLRVFINEDVCEGCGDCGVQSNCVAIVPVETELGRKRAVDQSACNKDYSCLKGFCPSFVTVEGGALRRRRAADGSPPEALPEPGRAPCLKPYSIVVSGIGGTGVVTVGALLGMAAHIEGKGVSVLDVAGLAQKNGEVYGHVRVAAEPSALHAARIGAGEADLLLGCDLVTAASAETLPALAPDRARAVVNAHETMTAAFTHDPDADYPEARLRATIAAAASSDFAPDYVDANGLAEALLGDSAGANVLLLGFACQKGLLPAGPAAIEQAIDLNGVAPEMNRRAFAWGRMLALDPLAVARAAGLPAVAPVPADMGGFDGLVARRAADLRAYQDEAHAGRYRALVERARAAEAERAPGRDGFAEAVAKAYYKLLAYKDEYEVARLYSDGRFARALAETFEGKFRLAVHLAPPLLGERDPTTGAPVKRAFGPWILTALRLLAPLQV
ncbi:MAG: indolepyruvate ferredoxin oxidoreductase family protein, partial [Rhodospirillales bacterium]|nr:indolepyruvate ferredoxin oxidoreductase family protein [Rhodospirillales bacterium]